MNRITSGITRLACLVWILAGVPAVAGAQMVDRTDPCFVRIFGAQGATNILTTGSWNNRDHLEAGALLIRDRSAWMLAAVTSAKASLQVMTPADLEELRGFNRCLPWLRRQLQLIEDQMKKLGVSSIRIPEDRHQVERDRFMRDVRDELEKTERMLNEILTVR